MAKLYFRTPRLATAIVGYIRDLDQTVPWDEIVEYFASADHPWKTVENRLYDLIAFGALHRVGGTKAQRALKITPLGRAWLEQEILAKPLFLGADLEMIEDQDDDEES